jgi:hypothetical protein
MIALLRHLTAEIKAVSALPYLPFGLIESLIAQNEIFDNEFYGRHPSSWSHQGRRNPFRLHWESGGGFSGAGIIYGSLI